MTSSLSNLLENLAAGIHKIKCKDCNCFLEYESVDDNLIKLIIKTIQTRLMKNQKIGSRIILIMILINLSCC